MWVRGRVKPITKKLHLL